MTVQKAGHHPPIAGMQRPRITKPPAWWLKEGKPIHVVEGDRVHWLTIANGTGEAATISITIKPMKTEPPAFSLAWDIEDAAEEQFIEGSCTLSQDSLVQAFDRYGDQSYRDSWFLRRGSYLIILITESGDQKGWNLPLLITDEIEDAVDALCGFVQP